MTAPTAAPVLPCPFKTWDAALRELFKAVRAVRDAHISTDTVQR